MRARISDGHPPVGGCLFRWTGRLVPAASKCGTNGVRMVGERKYLQTREMSYHSAG